jgi:hypothetical protein
MMSHRVLRSTLVVFVAAAGLVMVQHPAYGQQGLHVTHDLDTWGYERIEKDLEEELEDLISGPASGLQNAPQITGAILRDLTDDMHGDDDDDISGDDLEAEMEEAGFPTFAQTGDHYAGLKAMIQEATSQASQMASGPSLGVTLLTVVDRPVLQARQTLAQKAATCAARNGARAAKGQAHNCR